MSGTVARLLEQIICSSKQNENFFLLNRSHYGIGFRGYATALQSAQCQWCSTDQQSHGCKTRDAFRSTKSVLEKYKVNL